MSARPTFEDRHGRAWMGPDDDEDFAAITLDCRGASNLWLELNRDAAYALAVQLMDWVELKDED